MISSNVYLRDFAGHEEHERHHRGVFIAIDDKSHLPEPIAEVAGVPFELSDAPFT